MSVATLLGNTLLLAVPVAAVWSFAPEERFGLRRGATGAAIVLLTFLVLRVSAAALGYPLPTGGALEVLLFVSVFEEVAKYLSVRLPGRGSTNAHRDRSGATGVLDRRPFSAAAAQNRTGARNRDGIYPGAVATGLGFAAFENTAYLMVPTGAFLLRIALVGIIHIGTTATYAWSRRRNLTVSYMALGGGIAIHTAFNHLVRHLTFF